MEALANEMDSEYDLVGCHFFTAQVKKTAQLNPASSASLDSMRHLATFVDLEEEKADPGLTIELTRSSRRLSTPEPSDACLLEAETNSRSGGSCPPTSVYFEIVQPPNHARGYQAVVIVLEEGEVLEFEFVDPQTSRSKITVSKEPDLDEGDTLDGEHLPHFFSYTREERQWIRGASGRGRTDVPGEEGEEEEDFSDLWACNI